MSHDHHKDTIDTRDSEFDGLAFVSFVVKSFSL